MYQVRKEKVPTPQKRIQEPNVVFTPPHSGFKCGWDPRIQGSNAAGTPAFKPAFMNAAAFKALLGSCTAAFQNLFTRSGADAAYAALLGLGVEGACVD